MRDPLVLLTLALLLLIAGWSLVTYGLSLLALAWLVFGGGLLALAWIDARTGLLPDALTLPLMWLGIVLQLLPQTRTMALEAAIWGVIAGYVPLWGLAHLYRWWRGRDGLGFGDLKLLAAMGAWSGAALLPAVLLLASLSALAAMCLLRFLSYRDFRLDAELAFGPWLIGAYMVCRGLQTAGVLA